MRGVELPTQSDMIACLRLDGFVFSFCLTSLLFQRFLHVRPDTRRSSKTMEIACVRFFTVQIALPVSQPTVSKH